MININWLREDRKAQQKTLCALFAEYGKQIAQPFTPLAQMPFNARCQNCLHQANFTTLNDLNSISIATLLNLPAFGWGTLMHFITVYAQTFEKIHYSDITNQSELFITELTKDTETTFQELLGVQKIEKEILVRPLSVLALPMSKRVESHLEEMEIRTIADLLTLSPHKLEQCIHGGRELATEILQKTKQLLEQCRLTNTLRAALLEKPVRYQDLESAAQILDMPAEEVRTRLLAVPGVVIVANWVYWVEGCELTLLPKWDFANYRSLLQSILQQKLTFRQCAIIQDYYGLFSAPLPRKQLAEKHGGVAPQRIYQILRKSEQVLKSHPSLLTLVWLPVQELLRQTHGILSVAALERGLSDLFCCKPGEVRVTGLLAMLKDCRDERNSLTVFTEKVVLAHPVTPKALADLLEEIYEQLSSLQDGMPEVALNQALPEYWTRVMPGYPTPQVSASDLVLLHPKMTVVEGICSVRFRGRRVRQRITERLTQIGKMQSILSEYGKPMLVRDLFDECRKCYGEINVPACRTALKKNEDLFRAYERGVYGLVGWRDYLPSEISIVRLQSRRSNPRTLLDKIEAVLEENGLPMHFPILLRAVQDRFDEGDERGMRSALLVRPERFRSHGNGIYGLTMWGEDAAHELEKAVTEFLEQRGYAATETEVCDGLSGQFSISVPVCRWALRAAWERTHRVIPLEGGLWDISAEETTLSRSWSFSVDDILLEQLLSC